MPKIRPEPPHQHGTAPGTAVVLVNLGTPEAPTAPALKRYLRQFRASSRSRARSGG
ncbi:MAG: ferrochelatase [Proteobacteria bacterium]|nr:ferrochelatase [Pseudomonadota bacterium]